MAETVVETEVETRAETETETGDPAMAETEGRATVEIKIGDKVIRLVRGDITDMEIQAFALDMTSDLKLGSGYGGAVSSRGGKKVQEALDAIGTLPTGEAVITTAGAMKAESIIHANGPKYHEPDTEGKLRKTTESILRVADENGITRLALPPIGTGIYQVPLDLCAKVMIETVTQHLRGKTGLEEVVFVGLDTREYEPLRARFEEGT
jgi:O-acetyl-ADP-ribose deacetylase (regulator of RNase III)